MFTTNLTGLSEDYARIEQALLFLEENFQQQPDLKAVADRIGLSEYHFQRLFTRWAGISPKRFLQFLTVEYAKRQLDESKSVLDVTYAAGLSSPGRLHDLFVTCEALTPGQYKNKGQGLVIRYGFHPSPFGECLLAITERGICGLSFGPPHRRLAALADLQRHWPQAALVEGAPQTFPLVERIFQPVSTGDSSGPLNLYLQGTNFQLKVWQALLQIPPGAMVSYDRVAAFIGQPAASRAIGRATGHNPVGYLIPCHRVIRKIGQTGDYAWGATRKKAILGWEASRQLATHPA